MVEVLKQYPGVFTGFFEWLSRMHNGSQDGYESAHWSDQALALKVWLGYDQNPFTDQDYDSVKMYIDRIVSEYRDALKNIGDRKYDDPLYILSRMSERERQEKHPELFNQRGEPTILPSIKDAFNFNAIPKEVIEQIEHEDFWNNPLDRSGEVPF